MNVLVSSHTQSSAQRQKHCRTQAEKHYTKALNFYIVSPQNLLHSTCTHYQLPPPPPPLQLLSSFSFFLLSFFLLFLLSLFLFFLTASAVVSLLVQPKHHFKLVLRVLLEKALLYEQQAQGVEEKRSPTFN